MQFLKLSILCFAVYACVRLLYAASLVTLGRLFDVVHHADRACWLDVLCTGSLTFMYANFRCGLMLIWGFVAYFQFNSICGCCCWRSPSASFSMLFSVYRYIHYSGMSFWAIILFRQFRDTLARPPKTKRAHESSGIAPEWLVVVIFTVTGTSVPCRHAYNFTFGSPNSALYFWPLHYLPNECNHFSCHSVATWTDNLTSMSNCFASE